MGLIYLPTCSNTGLARCSSASASSGRVLWERCQGIDGAKSLAAQIGGGGAHAGGGYSTGRDCETDLSTNSIPELEMRLHQGVKPDASPAGA